MAEALAQRTRLDVYFGGVFGFSRSSHPNTSYLLEGMLRIAQFQVMYHKAKHQRPRPSQLAPQLLPPIAVPGHASFPSGHATQAYSLQFALAEVFRLAVGVVPSAAQANSPLGRLAQRIARNREVLGLHYPSDSEAGMDLARQTFDLANSANCPTIKSLIAAAAQEWREYAV
jgi:membrane-associated phospholipid phosphatase